MMANLWHAAWLGSEGAETGGNRAQLRRELDRLRGMGVTVVRILASSEACSDADEPLCRWTIRPAMQVAPGNYDHRVLLGLDQTMLELESRGMVAVLVLNNMHPGSGGMAQYIQWAGGPAAPGPGPTTMRESVSWNKLHFYTKTARFFAMPEAVRLSHDHIRVLLRRRNALTGRLYSQDPTIMSWELANAPRAMGKQSAYREWIASTAALVKRLAPNQLVTIGSEGAHASQAEEWLGIAAPKSGWSPDMSDFEADHRAKGIDYVTCQLWLDSWGWYDHGSKDEGLVEALDRAKHYLQAHVQAAARLGAPLVISEVGLARDDRKFGAPASTNRRNALFKAVFDVVQASVDNRDALSGVGFWGWTGEQRPVWRTDGGSLGPLWQEGDPLLADSIASYQGLNSVYDSDASTIALIKTYAHRWAQAGAR